MLSRYSLILLFLSIFAISCHKDDEGFNQEDINVFTAQVYQEVTSTIVGYVYDENNQPVAGADVAIYSTATKTSKHGTFIFKNVKMDKQGTYIKVVKNGYVLGSDYVYPAANTISYSYVKILKLDPTFEFNSQNGGTYTGTNGLGVTFAANRNVNTFYKRYTEPKEQYLNTPMFADCSKPNDTWKPNTEVFDSMFDPNRRDLPENR